MLDANLEGLLFLLDSATEPTETWGRRAYRNIKRNLENIRNVSLYTNLDRYQRAVADLNRILELTGSIKKNSLSLANFQDTSYSPLKSDDLIRVARQPEDNIFYPYFSKRLGEILVKKQYRMIGFSLNYLSQAISTFAMIGFIKQIEPNLPVALGGGLVTSWARNPGWHNPFTGIVNYVVPGPGENALLRLLGQNKSLCHHTPDFDGLPLSNYLAPGFILPYAASSGCYWNKCSFCPEKAEKNPYFAVPTDCVLNDIDHLKDQTNPTLIHFLDNAISPALLKAFTTRPSSVPWYGFARVHRDLTDVDFCHALRKSGCVLLKLGLESGNQDILDSMDKGIDLALVSKALNALKNAGIKTYVYLLFGTPSETIVEARHTLDFTVQHADTIAYLNLAIFNMPTCSPEAGWLEVSSFFEGDLSLYTDFVHPHGWNRKAIRRFLDQEFKRHPVIASILRRDPALFTSNHAPFFC